MTVSAVHRVYSQQQQQLSVGSDSFPFHDCSFTVVTLRCLALTVRVPRALQTCVSYASRCPVCLLYRLYFLASCLCKCQSARATMQCCSPRVLSTRLPSSPIVFLSTRRPLAELRLLPLLLVTAWTYWLARVRLAQSIATRTSHLSRVSGADGLLPIDHCKNSIR